MCLKKKIPTNYHQNVVHFNKIQKTSIQIIVHFSKKNIFNFVCHSKYFNNQFFFFPFEQISIKYEILKLMFM